jgi:hypothetical protein
MGPNERIRVIRKKMYALEASYPVPLDEQMMRSSTCSTA